MQSKKSIENHQIGYSGHRRSLRTRILFASALDQMKLKFESSNSKAAKPSTFYDRIAANSALVDPCRIEVVAGRCAFFNNVH